jgi:hypothetical protein
MSSRRQLFKKLGEWGVRKNYKSNNKDISTSPRDRQDDIVQAVSLTIPVQLSGTSRRQPIPVAAQTVASCSSQSAFVQVESSLARDPPQPDSVAPVANKFEATGNLSDNVTVPFRLVGGSNLSNDHLATVSGTELAKLSSSYLPLAKRWTGALPSGEVAPTPGRNFRNMYPETTSCLKESLSQVLDLVAGKIGHVSHLNALKLKNSVDTLLSLSQKLAEESESHISGFQGHHHHSLREGLNMTKCLIASSAIVTLNTYSKYLGIVKRKLAANLEQPRSVYPIKYFPRG